MHYYVSARTFARPARSLSRFYAHYTDEEIEVQRGCITLAQAYTS